MRAALALAAVTAALMLPSRAPAQASARPDSLPKRTLSFDRWLTEPTVIVLTAGQKPQIDSIRSEYRRELDKTRAEGKAMDFKSAVGAMARLDAKYQTVLRQRLTEDQVKILNANTKTHGG